MANQLACSVAYTSRPLGKVQSASTKGHATSRVETSAPRLHRVYVHCPRPKLIISAGTSRKSCIPIYQICPTSVALSCQESPGYTDSPAGVAMLEELVFLYFAFLSSLPVSALTNFLQERRYLHNVIACRHFFSISTVHANAQGLRVHNLQVSCSITSA